VYDVLLCTLYGLSVLYVLSILLYVLSACFTVAVRSFFEGTQQFSPPVFDVVFNDPTFHLTVIFHSCDHASNVFVCLTSVSLLLNFLREEANETTRDTWRGGREGKGVGGWGGSGSGSRVQGPGCPGSRVSRVQKKAHTHTYCLYGVLQRLASKLQFGVQLGVLACLLGSKNGLEQL
jgi:hypothetical protein